MTIDSVVINGASYVEVAGIRLENGGIYRVSELTDQNFKQSGDYLGSILYQRKLNDKSVEFRFAPLSDGVFVIFEGVHQNIESD